MDVETAGGIKKSESDEDSSLLKKYAQETSFSGIKYIGEDGSSIRRFIWLMVVLLALTGLAYQIINCTRKFLERPTSTKLTYAESELGLDFPAVTFCNTNMFVGDQLAYHYESLDKFYTVGLNQLLKIFNQMSITDALDVPIPEAWPGNMSFYELVANNGHSKENMFLKCQFNGESCGPENFTKTITNFGVCYTFNSLAMEPPLVVKTPGQIQGLSVLLAGETFRHIPAPRQNTGFKVLLHPRDEVPNLLDFGIEMDLGKRTSIRIEPTEVARLPEPWGECWKDQHVQLSYLAGQYTKSKCFLECETDFIVANCSCRSFYMPGNEPYCEPRTFTGCFYNAHQYFSANKNDLCVCEESCKETKYRASISQSTFPSSSVHTLQLVNQDFTFERYAFNDAMSGAPSTVYAEVYMNVQERMTLWFSLNTNANNVTLVDAFPDSSDAEVNMLIYNIMLATLSQVFYVINYAAYDQYYDIVVPYREYVNVSYGSPFYQDVEQSAVEQLLETGLYEITFSNYMFGIYYAAASAGSTNLTFEEFVNHTYFEHNLDESFYATFRAAFEEILAAMTDYGRDLYDNADIAKLTTDYMRENFALAEIYYGDLVVQQIKEQKDYELFQFICDWGGALGLFFGASLLSFIETIDFFSRTRTTKGTKS